MKKRIMFFSMLLLPLLASADNNGTCGDNVFWTYVESTKTLTISGEGAMRDYSNTGVPWYDYRRTIQKIVIEDGVLSIGANAFNECFNLTDITVPNSVKSIGAHSFAYCQSLTTLPVGNGVTTIGERAFWDCKNINSAAIPKSLESVEDRAFMGCEIEYVNISDLAAWCRINFNGLVSNPMSSSGRLYLNGEVIRNLIVPSSVKTIGNSVFRFCTALKSVTIPEGVTIVGPKAFSNCTELISVSIPNSVTSILSNAFEGCMNLNYVYITDLTNWCNIVFDDMASNPLNYSHNLYINEERINSLVIPESVTSIGKYAFSNFKNLTNITIPNSVTTIGKYAFFGCENVINIAIPNSISTIGESAFYGCSSLKTIIIPSSVEFIYQKAFAECSSLELVVSNANVPPYIYNDSFTNYSIPLIVPSECVESYQEAIGWENFLNITEGIYRLLYMVDGVEYKYYDVKYGTSITPEAAPTKDGYIFSGWSEIPETMPAHDVTITGTFTKDALNGSCGDGVTYSFNKDTHTLFISMTGEGTGTMEIIDTYTAPWEEYKSDIYNVDIEAGVTSIAAYSFRDCNNLVSVNIPSSVTSIGQVAFARCEKLAAISLPDGIKEIPASLFDGCKSLKSIELPDGITSIGEFAFMDCINLESILIPNGVSEIGAAAFYNCPQISSINLPENLSVIAEVAFSKCSSLTSIEIPNNVIKIESGAFAGCSSLQSIKSFITEPYSIQKDVFDENVYRQATLYIPKGTEKLYSRFDGWREFLNIVEMEDPADGIANLHTKDIKVLQNKNSIIISEADEGTPINIYDVSGKIVGSATAATGNTNIPTSLKPSDIGIVKVGEKTIKVIMK